MTKRSVRLNVAFLGWYGVFAVLGNGHHAGAVAPSGITRAIVPPPQVSLLNEERLSVGPAMPPALLRAFTHSMQQVDNGGPTSSPATVLAKQSLSATPDVDTSLPSPVGWSVDISGDTAVLGAPYSQVGGGLNQGAAYVFLRNASTGTWSQQAKLVASDGATDDTFGVTVGIDGDTIIVGAESATVDGNFAQGAAYIFTRTGTTWTEEQKLVASDGLGFEYFGASVGVDANTAVIGTPSGNSEGGAAYVFTRSGTTWTEQDQLLSGDDMSFFFGTSVAIAGDLVVVGSPYALVGEINPGSAYVFGRSSFGSPFEQQQIIVPSDGAHLDAFGFAVATDGNRVLIGAPYADAPPVFPDFVTRTDAGAAYVFESAGTTWTERNKLLAHDASESDYFGFGVALEGTTAVIGAPFGTGQVFGSGAAYFVTEIVSEAPSQQKVTDITSLQFDAFGQSVAIQGGRAIVGVPWNFDASVAGDGGGVVFDLVSTQDDMTVDFGSAGLWVRGNHNAGGSWSQLHASNAGPMASANLDNNDRADLIVDFPGFGVWVHLDDGSWFQLETRQAESIVVGDFNGNGNDDVVLDLGSAGAWLWMDSSFKFQLLPLNPTHLAAADLDGNGKMELIVDLPGFGLWTWLNTQSWLQLHSLSVEGLTTGDFDGNGKADVLIDFGTAGLWGWYNNSAWIAIHSASAGAMAAGDLDGNGQADAIVEFPGFGLWIRYNDLTWVRLHPFDADGLSTGDLNGDGRADVVVDFGSSGLWVWISSSGSWGQLHPGNPEGMVIGDVDGE